MTVPTHNLLAIPFIGAVEDHECVYAERVLALDEQRQLGLTAYALLSLSQDLVQLHNDGQCPPTHIDGSPTKAWSDWVDATKQ